MESEAKNREIGASSGAFLSAGAEQGKAEAVPAAILAPKVLHA